MYQNHINDKKQLCDIISVSTAENNFIELSIKPNPFDGQLEIILNSSENNVASIEVFDVLGHLVFSKSNNIVQIGFNSFVIDLKGLTAGSYLLRVKNSLGTQLIRKIVKL